jgi:predicted MFS family arabinose efflux permease
MTVERRLVMTLWCAGLAAFTSLYAPQGLLPQIARDMEVDASQAALLISAATLGLALSVLPWAWVADRMGVRTAMRAAAGSAAVCVVVVPFLPSFEAMLAGRLAHGITLGGIPALAMTLSHDVAVPARAGTVAGGYIAATSVGGLSGRLFTVPVADFSGWRTALLIMGVAVAVLMIAMIGLIPASATDGRADGMLQTVRGHLRNRAVWPILLVGLLLSGAVMTVFNYLPFRLAAAPYGLEPAVSSLIFLTYLGGTAGSRAAGWLGWRFGPHAVLGGAGALVVVGAVVTMTIQLAAIVAGVALLTIGFFVGHAVASSLVAARAAVGRSQATALYSIAYYSGASIFGWVGGIAWAGGQWPAVALLVIALGVAAIACTTVSPSRL